MTVEESKGPVPEETLSAIEGALGYELPEDYRSFLKEHGAARLWPLAFDFADGSEGSLLDELYEPTLNERTYSSLLNIRRVFKDALPLELLAIGCDPGGNQLCIALAPPRRGQILFWSHESGTVESLDDALEREDLKVVATSFTAFLDALFED